MGKPIRFYLMTCICLPVAVFVSPAAAEFEDVREAVGLEGFPPHGFYSIAWGDFNADGWVDLFAGGELWVNNEGFFQQLSTGIGERVYGVWGDYDNDGDIDLFTYEPAQIFRNDGNNTFVAQSFPQVPMTTSLSACCGDFDGDGDLDIYMGGYEVGTAEDYQPDAIFTNAGDGTFTLSWQTPGRRQPARGASPADFDEDGDLDIYVSNYRLEANLLFQNDGQGNFTDIGESYGVSSPDLYGHTVGSAWGDLDNDGHLDLVAGNFSHFGQPAPQLLKNLGSDGGFRFENKTANAGIGWVESHTNPALGDYDNDGDLDLFICASNDGDEAELYRNNDNWTFTEVTEELGITSERLHSAAWVDYDNDGWLDLLVQRYQTVGHLYRNLGGSNHWLKVRLTCGISAVGAQVRISLGARTLIRQVEGGTSELNQSPAILHFGLGQHDTPVTLQIHWLGGGMEEVTTEVDRLVGVGNSGQLQATIDNSATPSLITISPVTLPPPMPTPEVTAQLANHILPKSNNRGICVIQSGNFVCDENSDGDVTDTVPLGSLFSVQFDSPAQLGLVSEADFQMDGNGNITFTGFKGPFNVGGYDGGQGQLTPDIDNGSEPAIITFSFESTDVELALSDFGPTEVFLWEPAYSTVGGHSRYYSLGSISGATMPVYYDTFGLNFDDEHLEFTLDLGTGDVTTAAPVFESGTLNVTIDNGATPSLITIEPIPVSTREVTAQLAFNILPQTNNRSICVIQSGLLWVCDFASDGDVTDSVALDSSFSVQFDSPAQLHLVTEADFDIDTDGNITFTGFKGPFNVGGYDGGQGQLAPDIDNGLEPAVITFNLESTDVEFVLSGFGPTETLVWEPAYQAGGVALHSRDYSLGVTSGEVISVHYDTFGLNFNNDTEHLEFSLDLGTGDVTEELPLYSTGTLQVTIDNGASPSLITISP